MAYEKPTPADLIIRYPALASIPEETRQYWLTDAERIVTVHWPESEYTPALMALAAHNLTLAGAGGQSSLPAGVTRFRSGAMDVSLSEAAVSAKAKGGYGATGYGQEFEAMLRRVVGGPRLVSAR